MPSTKQYNLVPNDEYDTRIPLHPDVAFEYGITFQAKVRLTVFHVETKHKHLMEFTLVWRQRLHIGFRLCQGCRYM